MKSANRSALNHLLSVRSALGRANAGHLYAFHMNSVSHARTKWLILYSDNR